MNVFLGVAKMYQAGYCPVRGGEPEACHHYGAITMQRGADKELQELQKLQELPKLQELHLLSVACLIEESSGVTTSRRFTANRKLIYSLSIHVLKQ